MVGGRAAVSVDDVLCGGRCAVRWTMCCVGGRCAVSVDDVLCRWSRCCVGGRGAARMVDALCVGRGVVRVVEELRGRSRRCVGVSDASREALVLLRLLGVVCLRSF